MIFLFFGTTPALLEAKLAPFKDLEEMTFSNVANFSQSLNRANSASRRAREVPKKRKIIRI